MKADPGRLALVTGASGGVGTAVLRRLASDGWEVVAHGNRWDGPAPSDAAHRLTGDLTTSGGVEDLVDAVRSIVKNSGLRLIAHCAGRCTADSDCDATDSAAMFMLHGYAFHRLVVGLEAELSIASGRAVLVSSSSAVKATPGQALYGATKAAGESIVRSLGYQLGRKNIQVIGIRPSLVRTRMSEAALADDAVLGHFERQSPLGRIATAEDMADVVMALSSGLPRWLTSETVWVDGGVSHGWGDEFDD